MNTFFQPFVACYSNTILSNHYDTRVTFTCPATATGCGTGTTEVCLIIELLLPLIHQVTKEKRKVWHTC